MWQVARSLAFVCSSFCAIICVIVFTSVGSVPEMVKTYFLRRP